MPSRPFFSKRHLRSSLSSIRARPPPSRLQTSETTSSGGSARKPAHAPHSYDDAVGMAWRSRDADRGRDRGCTIRCGIWYDSTWRRWTMVIRWLVAAVHLLARGIGLGSVWARGRALRQAPDERAVRRALAADAAWGIAALLWVFTGLW